MSKRGRGRPQTISSLELERAVHKCLTINCTQAAKILGKPKSTVWNSWQRVRKNYIITIAKKQED